MTTEIMTVHEALTALKMLDKRITDAIFNFTPCKAVKYSIQKIGSQTREEYAKSIKSDYESIRTMMKRRAAIKSAVICSNAKTMITIAGEEISVADAIEMKLHGNQYASTLASLLSAGYSKENAVCEKENGDKLTEKADAYVTGMFSSKEKNFSADTVNGIRDMYIKANKYDLIDPIGAANEAKMLNDKIEAFNTELDGKISVSNAVTTITVEY